MNFQSDKNLNIPNEHSRNGIIKNIPLKLPFNKIKLKAICSRKMLTAVSICQTTLKKSSDSS